MATYKYEIIDSDGKKKKGTLDAQNKDAAMQELQGMGNFVVSLAVASAFEKDIEIHIGAAVKPRELSIFCRQFQSVLHAGVTVIDAMTMLEEQTENKTFKKALADVRDSVQRGETLSDSMAAYPKIFPEIMIHMVNSGEVSGNLEITFDRLAMQFEKDAHLRGLIGKSMIYPAVLVVVIIGVVAVMMIKIVPTFTDTFAELDAELPGITKLVMGVSNFMVHTWYIILIVVVGLWIFLKEFKKTEHGAMLFGKLGLKLPVFGNLTIKSASCSLTRTMSTLIASGISTLEAVEITERIMKNAIVKQALHKARKDVEIGVPLSVPIKDSGVFPPMVYHMIEIGEETGNMEEMLDKIAEYYDEEVETATQSLVALMEPLIIIMMALIVVPIILAIMLPMLTLENAIDSGSINHFMHWC